MNINLNQRKAIVCGASKGIGRAIAFELASLGSNVTLLARNEESLRKIKDEIEKKFGGKHDYLSIDFSQNKQTRDQIEKYVSAKGPFHILINNSGGPPAGLVHKAQMEEFTAAFSQHLLTNHLMMQCVIDGMKSEKYGRIINIISTSVKQPVPGLGVSNTIRGAVANWAKTLAGEVAEYGITVNNVLPGSTETDRLWEVFKSRATQKNVTFENIVEHEKQIIPAKRFGKPEEVAQAVAFLASPSAAYINGINLPVDGGRTGCL